MNPHSIPRNDDTDTWFSVDTTPGPTTVHIQIDPNATAHDVAEIMARSPKDAHFILHTGRDLAVLDGPTMRATRDPAVLAEHFVKLAQRFNLGTQTLREFNAKCYEAATAEPKVKPIVHGPQRNNRKGKLKRW